VEVVRDPDLGIFEDVLRKASKVFSVDDVSELEVDVSECRWCEFRGVRCKGDVV
jgi:hypothetical protein